MIPRLPRASGRSVLKALGLFTVAAACVSQGSVFAQNEGKTSSDKQVIDYINHHISKSWTENEISPSANATDGEWLRRLYLDMIGRIPTLDETKGFMADKSEDKKAKWVDKLLFSEEYELELARNWTTIWTNLLIGRNGGNDRRRPVNRAGLQQFIRRSFLKNMPYDKFVFELVAADGNNTPGEEDYNGAANFILDNLQEMQVPATNKVSQLFLGLRVGCTQCHNHPFNDWKQSQFWSMNAFFRQANTLRTMEGRDVLSASLRDGDFAGEGSDPENAEIYYELRNGLLKVAYPTFVDGTRINASGFVSDVNRRDELGKLIIKSPYMSAAIVNRMWGHFFGFGFTKPVDDMGPHNPPSHPELLEKMGTDFAAYGYDLRRLMRWITLSDAYGLSSRFGGSNSLDDPTRGETPLFSHYYVRQMNAEQLYESIMAATTADQTGKTYEEQEKIKNDWLQQFVIAFGTDENDEATTFNGTIPQALMMMNGDIMKKATSIEKGAFLWKVAASGDKASGKINDLYIAALSRTPTSSEVSMANNLWQARKGDVNAALQDIWWALLNSNEFIIQH